ncbi:MAG: hypothetical protein JO199_03620 [Candidatus Eremiobacteraeota bacterium]|nr:hypothetical protein [Candidatus Eremiobacteraeota bacterium]
MKSLSIAVLLAASLLPAAASAQTAPQQAPPPQASPYQQPGQPNADYGQRAMNRWMRMLQPLNLSSQQQSQIQQALTQYVQSHPPGTHDPQGRRALLQQIFTVLTPQQQDQLRQTMETLRQERLQRMQQQNPQQQPAPQQAPPQGQPPR